MTVQLDNSKLLELLRVFSKSSGPLSKLAPQIAPIFAVPPTQPQDVFNMIEFDEVMRLMKDEWLINIDGDVWNSQQPQFSKAIAFRTWVGIETRGFASLKAGKILLSAFGSGRKRGSKPKTAPTSTSKSPDGMRDLIARKSQDVPSRATVNNIAASIAARQGQKEFRDELLTAYGDGDEEYTSGWQTGTLWYAKDLRPDRVYLIKLIARNEAGQRENGLNFVWVKLAPPDITGQTAKCDSVTLAWQNNSGYAQGFKVYRDEQVVAELGAEAVSYMDNGVAASSSYVYKVEVVGEHTYAASSSQLEYINTPACNTPQQPVAPQLVSPAQSAQFSVGQPITFQWLGGVADRYQLYVNRLTGGESRTIDLTETSYTIADLPPGSYQWFVSSITEAGQVGSSMGLFSVTENQTAFQLYLPLVTR